MRPDWSPLGIFRCWDSDPAGGCRLRRAGWAAQELSSAISSAGAQAPQSRQQLVARHNRHRSERIVEARAATTADLVTAPTDGEDAAQLRMVTTEGKLQCSRQRMRNGVP